MTVSVIYACLISMSTVCNSLAPASAGFERRPTTTLKNGKGTKPLPLGTLDDVRGIDNLHNNVTKETPKNIVSSRQTASLLDQPSRGISMTQDDFNSHTEVVTVGRAQTRDHLKGVTRLSDDVVSSKGTTFTGEFFQENQKYDHRIEHRIEGEPQTTRSPPFKCGEGLCVCDGDTADCSGHSNGLPYVPELPNGTHSLNLSYNGIRDIPADFFANVSWIPELPNGTHSLNLSYNGIRDIPADFFANVSWIYLLSLSGNDIRSISSDAFQSLRVLYVVFIDFNKNSLQYDVLRPIVTMPLIEKLSIRQSGLQTPPRWFFSSPNFPNLKILLLHDNFLTEVNLNDFQGMKLEKLGIAKSTIVRLSGNSTLYSLQKLNLNSNGLFYFPATCDRSRRSLFPNLTKLQLKENKISVIPELVCLPNLTLLELAQNRFYVIPSNAFNSQRFPGLVELHMYSMTTHIKNIAAYAFNNTSLQRVTLTYDSLNFDTGDVEEGAFANCPNIENLQLSHNFFTNISEDQFVQLFGHLTSMIYMYMESCQLQYLTRKMLSPFRGLKFLSLNRNTLSNIPDGTFDDLATLQKLDLSSNQVTAVSSILFSSTLQQKLLKLDLSGNPFDCSCEILWFLAWFMSKPKIFQPSLNSYECFNIKGLPIDQFVLSEQACLLSRSAALFVSIILTLVIFSFTAFLLAFRYRWHVRLVLYEAFRGRGDARRRRLETGDFDYDVFVSFDTKDLPFVKDHLMPQLESVMGLRLCIHQRDFVVGKYIVDNIADCVQKSKKVMMLFSKPFAESQWCQFELSYCLRHVMDLDDDLLIVCLDDVCSRDLTAAMMAVLKTTTYIRWVGDHQDAVRAFWGQLEIALHEISRRRRLGPQV